MPLILQPLPAFIEAPFPSSYILCHLAVTCFVTSQRIVERYFARGLNVYLLSSLYVARITSLNRSTNYYYVAYA